MQDKVLSWKPEVGIAALDQIQQNISLHGHHLYVVSGAPDPRFAYTTGLSPSLGFELILAGAAFYMLPDLTVIISDSCN